MYVVEVRGPLKVVRWLIALESGFALTSSIENATHYSTEESAREDLRRAGENDTLRTPGTAEFLIVRHDAASGNG